MVKIHPIPKKPINITIKPKDLPMPNIKWVPIEPIISKISIFSKVEITFPIALKFLNNLTLIDETVLELSVIPGVETYR